MPDCKAAVVFPVLGLDIGLQRAGLTVSWVLGHRIDYAMECVRRHQKCRVFEDTINFPYRLKAGDLAADVWCTGNALAAIMALRKACQIGAQPQIVLARLPSPVDLPSLIRIWHDSKLFQRIEWCTVPLCAGFCSRRSTQCYLLGTLHNAKGLSLKEGSDCEFGDTLKEEWATRDGWKGPSALNPHAETTTAISIVQCFRSAANSRTVRDLITGWTALNGLCSYDTEHPFAKFKFDETDGRVVLSKLCDNQFTQLLLDGSLENFNEVWPDSGACLEDGALARGTFRIDDSASEITYFPSFEKVRNCAYISAVCGLPNYGV